VGDETFPQRGGGVEQRLTCEQVERSEEQCDHNIPEEPGDESLGEHTSALRFHWDTPWPYWPALCQPVHRAGGRENAAARLARSVTI